MEHFGLWSVIFLYQGPSLVLSFFFFLFFSPYYGEHLIPISLTGRGNARMWFFLILFFLLLLSEGGSSCVVDVKGK